MWIMFPNFNHTSSSGFVNVAQKIISINIYWASCNYLGNQNAQWFCRSDLICFSTWFSIFYTSVDEKRSLPCNIDVGLFGDFAVFWKLVQTFYRREAQRVQIRVEGHTFTRLNTGFPHSLRTKIPCDSRVIHRWDPLKMACGFQPVIMLRDAERSCFKKRSTVFFHFLHVLL